MVTIPTRVPEAAQDEYRAAMAAVCAGQDPLPALRRAVAVDPAFAAAVADLNALTRDSVVPTQPEPGSSWERRHVEIVTAARSDIARAEALLREHAVRSGCDPFALLVVSEHLDGIDGSRLRDLRGDACTCDAAVRLR